MQHIILVRHGITEDMEKRLMQGSSDSPLSPRGREEARRTGEVLSTIAFDAAFASPLGRAWETAQITAQPHAGLKVIPLNDLHEMDFGFFEGKPFFASPDEEPHGMRRLFLLMKVLFAQITGESLRSVSRRAVRSWKEISARVPEGRLLIVSHGVLINYLLKHLLDEEVFKSLRTVGIKPCSITELKVPSAGSAKLIRFNDTAHLINPEPGPSPKLVEIDNGGQE
jgi:probable phosphoglycerate mutase